MRPEFDSEIDSVLRGHARRGGASSVAWEGGLRPSISNESVSDSHLDADEIAAFGEGALPQAACARYATHLADCDDCRRSVTQVMLASGVADRIEERERGGAAVTVAAATQSPSWRERLAAVFAPRAWPYAMPVVALLAVGTVVFVVMRGPLRDGGMETAGKRDNAAQRSAAPAAPESHHADMKQQPAEQLAKAGAGNTADVAPQTAEGEESGRADDELAKLRSKNLEGAGQSAVGGAAGTLGAGPRVAQPVQAEPPPSTESYTITSATPSPAPPLSAAAPAPRQMVLRDIVPLPTPAPTHEHAEAAARERKSEDSRAVAASRDEAPATKRHGPQRGGAGRVAELSSAPEASKDDRAASRRARESLKSEANRNDTDGPKAGREEDREQRAETRSVGGRRFRREGNAWIDTAYKSSQATVVVRRDSEQYRALVADEPEIGRISRSLGGEAIIVWKGRAYRIKP